MRRLFLIALSVLAVFCLYRQGWALERLVFGTPMPSGKVMPIIVAKESGMFEKYGVNVEIQYFQSGTMATTALVAGSTVMGCSGGADAIQAILGGADIVIISGIFNYVDGQIVGARDITSPEQLKGKNVGISAFGANSEFQVKTALKHFGLVPGKDVILLQVGPPTQRLAALEAGKVQATIIEPPVNLVAKKMGMNTLLDLLDLKIPAQMIVIVTTRGFAEKNPDLVEKYLKGLIAGIHYMRTHRRETIEMMRKSMKIEDMQALEETYQEVLVKGVPEKPYPSSRGVQILLDWLEEKNPKAKAAKAEDMVDTRFVSKLDSTGFIDGLYKK